MIRAISYQETITGLRQAAKRRNVPMEQINVYLELLEREEQCLASLDFSGIDMEEVRARWDRGLCALSHQVRTIDLDVADELFVSLAGILVKHIPAYAGEVAKAIQGDRSFLATAVDGHGQAPSQEISFLIAHTLHPFMVGMAKAIKTGDVGPKRWIEPYCPICAGLTDMASLSQETGARTLLCSQCDCEWPYRRIGCPYCRNDDAKTIHYYSDDSGIYRLYSCDECGKYLKTVDHREAEREFVLSAERWLSQSMDMAARDLHLNTIAGV